MQIQNAYGECKCSAYRLADVQPPEQPGIAFACNNSLGQAGYDRRASEYLSADKSQHPSSDEDHRTRRKATR